MYPSSILFDFMIRKSWQSHKIKRLFIKPWHAGELACRGSPVLDPRPRLHRNSRLPHERRHLLCLQPRHEELRRPGRLQRSRGSGLRRPGLGRPSAGDGRGRLREQLESATQRAVDDNYDDDHHGYADDPARQTEHCHLTGRETIEVFSRGTLITREKNPHVQYIRKSRRKRLQSHI
jgi:hypothetical protein